MRTPRRLRSLAFLVAVLVSTGGAALAQTGATTVDLAGTVFDATKAVLVGATVTATNLATGVERATFSQEAVREFQVVANSYSAEFGKASGGGVVNIVTKSGGNRVAGNAFVYVRDDALNARDHFEMYYPDGRPTGQEKSPFSRYQFGGTIGGPIRKNQAFYFLSADRLRSQANNYVNIDDTKPITVYGTDYGTLVDIFERAGFRIDLGQLPYRVDADQVLGRVDLESRDHRLAPRFNWSDVLDENAERWGGQIAKSRGAARESRDLMGAASLTSFFSPRLMNELRFQVAYHDQNIRSFDPKCSPSCDGEDEGGPTVEVGAVAVGRQRFTPQSRTDVRHQVGNVEYNPVTNNPLPGSRPLDVNGVPRTSGLWRQFTAWGESWYRGPTLSLSRRYARGYRFLASYTWSKAEDLMADFGFQQPQDVGAGRNPDDPSGLPRGFDPYAERGPSATDH